MEHYGTLLEHYGTLGQRLHAVAETGVIIITC